MLKNIAKFIKELQDSDEKRKRRWLFVLSALAISIVIVCWLIHLNKVIIGLGAGAETANAQSSNSFWQTFLVGLKIIGGQIKIAFLEAKNIILKGREINIEMFK